MENKNQKVIMEYWDYKESIMWHKKYSLGKAKKASADDTLQSYYDERGNSIAISYADFGFKRVVCYYAIDNNAKGLGSFTRLSDARKVFER